MAKKPKKEKVPKPEKTPKPKKVSVPKDNGILLPILYALLAGVGMFTFVLCAGIGWTYMNPPEPSEIVQSPPPAAVQSQPVTRTSTEPVQSPDVPAEGGEPDASTEPESEQSPAESEPADSTSPSQSQEPVQSPSSTPAATPSNSPADPATSVVSAQSSSAPSPVTSQTPTQSGGNDSATYEHDFSGGRMLGTINSDKYHYYDCTAAKKIPPENEVWFDSEDAAISAGRTRCGICWR